MRTQAMNRVAAAATAFAAYTGVAHACQTINFETLAVGTAVTNQYPGVTFSITVQNCGAGTTRYPRIIDPAAGTSSGTRALGEDQGCPDFWAGALRMVFTNPQQEVLFKLGDFSTGTYTVRAWDAPVGGSQILPTQNIDLEGAGPVAVYRLVSVAGPGIRRIEIDSTVDNQVVIDDLEFDLDSTPPMAVLDDPDAAGCVCSPIVLTGTADDPDGLLSRRRVYYSADDGATWTLISNSATPVNAGVLYTWNTAGLAEGQYLLLLRVINACGMESTAVRTVWVDRQFDDVEIRYPAPLQVVGGGVCVDGTVYDRCPRGADAYTVLYGVPGASGPIGPVDPAHPTYAGNVVNDPLTTPAPWHTEAGATRVVDGTWRIAVSATDHCGFTRIEFRDVIVDNTPPAAILTSPTRCTNICGIVPITGTANDLHFGHWYLEYTGGDAPGWVPIADGGAPIIGALLANWNTAGLRRCAYTIRLRAYDTASVNCGSTTNSSETTVSVNLGDAADFNKDGAINSQDFFDFLAAFFAGPLC
jgi:hypothetical protein